jgi:hypothetical protein
VRAGRTREPIRVRDMTYEVNPFSKEVKISLPTENILSASLGGLFGPQGLNAGGRRSGESDESGDSGGESGTTGTDPGAEPAPAPAEPGGAPPAAPPAGAPPPGG